MYQLQDAHWPLHVAREASAERLRELRRLALESPLADELSRRCVVFVSGSLARGEATEGSDLDCFLLHQWQPGQKPLSTLEAAAAMSALEAVRSKSSFGRAPFSSGGAYLAPLRFTKLIQDIGDPREDGRNFFTARMMLLINSKALTVESTLDQLRDHAMDQYWSTLDSRGRLQYIEPNERSLPLMFFNDLRRWWLSVALNFERANRPEALAPRLLHASASRISPRVQRRLESLKLRFSRMLEVHSILLESLTLEFDGGIRRTDLEGVLRGTTVDRLVNTARTEPRVVDPVEDVLSGFAEYLTFRSEPNFELWSETEQYATLDRLAGSALRTHRSFYRAYDLLGRGSDLYPYLII